VVVVVVVEAAAVPAKFTALAVLANLAAVHQVPAAGVQQGGRGTMHPHPITAMLLRVDAIPIHRAKDVPGEEREIVRPLLGQAAFSVWVSR
jgi:hypothetical protein